MVKDIDTGQYNIVCCVHEDALAELIIHSKKLIPHFENLGDVMGDYIVGGWVLERCTVSDFLGKIISGRLWEQASKLARLPEDYHCGFIIEGSLNFGSCKRAGVKMAQAYGALNKLVLDYQLPVFYTASKKHTVTFLEKLLTAAGKAPFDILTTIREKGYGKATTREQQEYFLQGLPGIGAKHAHELLLQYGDLNNCLIALMGAFKPQSMIIEPSVLSTALTDKLRLFFSEPYIIAPEDIRPRK